MTDQPDEAAFRDGAERAFEKANVIVDAMIQSLHEFEADGTGVPNSDMDRAGLITVALAESFGEGPSASLTIASAAIVRLAKAEPEKINTHLSDDR